MNQIATITRTLGDTLDPINAVIYDDNDNPVDLTSPDVKVAIEDDSGTEILAETTTGITKHPTQTFTASGTTALATCNGHGVRNGDQIIVANSGGALPSGLAASTRYFAVNVTPNAFGLASVPDGQSVIAGAGTGTHTFYIVGSVQYDLASTEVDTAATYRLWFVRVSGSEKRHHPEGESFIRLNIKTRGN